MNNNDYAEAKKECMEVYRKWMGCTNDNLNDDMSFTFHYAFDFAYDRAYKHGCRLANERLQVAAMAMQGLLTQGMTNNSPEFVAERAIVYADALLIKLNKKKQ